MATFLLFLQAAKRHNCTATMQTLAAGQWVSDPSETSLSVLNWSFKGQQMYFKRQDGGEYCHLPLRPCDQTKPLSIWKSRLPQSGIITLSLKLFGRP